MSGQMAGNMSPVTNTTEPKQECSEPEFYSMLYASIGTFFQSIIFLVGIVGNTMVIFTVKNTQSLHTTTNCYLVSLALADLITLITSCPQEILSYHILGDRWLWGEWSCPVIIYSQYTGINASALSLTAFTVERYIAICHPMKAQYICTLSRAKKIILMCWLFALIYDIPWFLITHIDYDCVEGYGQVAKCRWKLSRDSIIYKIMFFSDITLFYVIPLLLSSLLYCLIAQVLLRTRQNEILSTTNQARVQVVKMLAAVVIIFACLWCPYRGFLVYNTIKATLNHELYMDLWFLMFAKSCVYINCAINPILYNAMSTKFRRAFRKALTCSDDYTGNCMTQPFTSNIQVTTTRVSQRVSGVVNTCTYSNNAAPPQLLHPHYQHQEVALHPSRRHPNIRESQF